MSEPSQTGHNLKPLGIQLTRLEEGNKVFTPSTNEKTEASTDLQWLYAKILVQNADAIVMEFIHHLGIGHLALEPVIIAYFNWVHSSNPDPKNEAIIKMLEPHMDKTLAINDLARHSLVAKKNSTTDTLISTGTFFGVKAFANKYRTLEYSDFCFPKQVEKRGFAKDGSEGIKGYFFRDDGYQMWDALYQYANTAVNHCYDTDEDVVENSELQNFFSEMSSPDKGNFVPFRNLEVDSKEKLTEALTCIIFQASAYHAVQNNAQFDYFGFVPNKPLAVTYQAIDDPDLTMEKIHRSLPDQQHMLKQMILTYTLSCPTTDNLCDLHALKELVPEAHGNLMESFGTLEKSIGDRNCECHKNNEIPYPYFLPSTCNVSVNM